MREKSQLFGELPLIGEEKTGFVIFVTHRSFAVIGEFIMVEFRVKVKNSFQNILSVNCRLFVGRQFSLCFGLQCRPSVDE